MAASNLASTKKTKQVSFHSSFLDTSKMPSQRNSIVAKLDSRATGNYTRLKDAHILKHRSKIKNGPAVNLPDSSITTSSEDDFLPISSKLLDRAIHAYTFSGITNSTLIFVGKLCNDDCEVLFTKDIALV